MGCMRMNPELLEKILIAVESDPNAGSGQSVSIAVEGYRRDVIAHHVKYLVETDMLRAQETTHLTSPYPEFLVFDITPAGRAFLDEREPEPPKRSIGF